MSWLPLFLILVISATGCDTMLYQRFEKDMWSNNFRVNDVKMGMSKSEVRGIMGEPGIKEEGDYRGGHYSIYFYLTHSMDFPEGDTVRGGYTPMVFKDNRLVAIGKRDYRMAVDRPEEGNIPNLPWAGKK